MPTRSPLAGLHGAQVPRIRLAPSVRANDWEDVADLAKGYGLVLDPWQENVLQAAMGVRSDGQWASPTVGVSVPRQNGKGAIIEARELAGLLLFGEKTIIHSAHEQKTARVGFERILSYFENYDDLRKKVRGKPMSALGREHIKLRNGSELHFPARSKGAIRGFSIDCLILDEGQILGDPAWDAIKPTISARPNVQTWVLGTPPTPLDDGAVFTRMRQRGVEGKDHRLCWCEWSAPANASLDDRAAWEMANPALGLRISEEAVADERNELSPQGFGRERLGIWDEVAAANAVIPADIWDHLTSNGPLDGTPPTGIAADASHDGVLVVAGCWRTEDDVSHLELLAVDRWTDDEAAADWIADRAKRRIPVVIDGASPAARLIPLLRTRKVKILTGNAGDMSKACAGLLSGATTSKVTHGGVGDELVAQALVGATKRKIGDAGGWGWDRRDASVNIAPLVAETLARHAASLNTRQQRTGETRFR